MLFFSRDVARSNAHRLADKHIKHCVRSNVVSHSTYASPRLSFRGVIYGRRCKPCIPNSSKLARHAQIKTGVSACHYRINGHPKDRNDGKLLVFQSGNAIRAGKHSHEDALLKMFNFNTWVRKTCGVHHEWHTAVDNPNMVISGQFKHMISHTIANDPACTKTSKFPGIQITVPSHLNSTPELYLKRSTFIVPGVTSPNQLAEILRCIVAIYAKYKLSGVHVDVG